VGDLLKKENKRKENGDNKTVAFGFGLRAKK